MIYKDTIDCAALPVRTHPISISPRVILANFWGPEVSSLS